jgi:transposase InsO family protein
MDALEGQIRILKNIVAKQSIELEFKTELLKKRYAYRCRKHSQVGVLLLCTLTHMLRFNIKKGHVIVLLSLLLMEYKIEGITLRNDNGSQFTAGVVRQFLKDKGVNQEFTHVATLEENA